MIRDEQISRLEGITFLHTERYSVLDVITLVQRSHNPCSFSDLVKAYSETRKEVSQIDR